MRQGINSGVAIGEMAADPPPRRVVYAAFNERGAITRRTDKRDRFAIRVSTRGNLAYRAMKGGRIRRDDIQYFPGWLTEAGDEARPALVLARIHIADLATAINILADADDVFEALPAMPLICRSVPASLGDCPILYFCRTASCRSIIFCSQPPISALIKHLRLSKECQQYRNGQ